MAIKQSARRLKNRVSKRRHGFVLVAVSAFLLALAVLLGVFLDLSRVQMARRRAQLEADAAALDAVRELDGTASGIERALAVVSRRSEGAAVQTEFWNPEHQEWTGNPAGGQALIALRVKTSRSLPLYFMPALGGEREAVVAARAAAAQEQQTEAAEGLFPYAARVADTADLAAGSVWELEWAAGPMDLARASEAIASGWPGVVVRIGDRLSEGEPAWRWQRDALRRRATGDGDSRSADYAGYSHGGQGNGRRIVLLPIVNGAGEVTGFGAFLLPPATAMDQPPLRAEYAGAYLEGSRWRAAASGGAWVARLIQ